MKAAGSIQPEGGLVGSDGAAPAQEGCRASRTANISAKLWKSQPWHLPTKSVVTSPADHQRRAAASAANPSRCRWPGSGRQSSLLHRRGRTRREEPGQGGPRGAAQAKASQRPGRRCGAGLQPAPLVFKNKKKKTDQAAGATRSPECTGGRGLRRCPGCPPCSTPRPRSL